MVLQRDAQVKVLQECPVCHGSGERPYSMQTCYKCDGAGKAELWVPLVDLAALLMSMQQEWQQAAQRQRGE